MTVMTDTRNEIIGMKGGILTIAINEPLSLLGLTKEFGFGKTGFKSTGYLSTRYSRKNEFVEDTPESGVYEINTTKQLAEGLPKHKQASKIPEDWDFPHPAVISHGILLYYYENYQKKENRLLEKWITRTSLTDSDGVPVNVGLFSAKKTTSGVETGEGGLSISVRTGGYSKGPGLPIVGYDPIGVALTRKIA